MAQLVGKLASARLAVGSSFPMTSRSMTSSGCGEHSVTEAPRDVAPIERTRRMRVWSSP